MRRVAQLWLGVAVVVLVGAQASAASSTVFRVEGAASLLLSAQGTGPYAVVPTANRNALLVLNGNTGSITQLATPPGCAPRTIRGALLGLLCGPDTSPTGAAVLDVRTGATAQLNVPPDLLSRTGDVRVGQRWVELETFGSDELGRPLRARYLINRDTRQRIDEQHDPFGPARVIDLNTTSGARRLCAPLHRQPEEPSVGSDTYAEAIYTSGQLLSFAGHDYTFQRCAEQHHSLSADDHPQLAGDALTRWSGRHATVDIAATIHHLTLPKNTNHVAFPGSRYLFSTSAPINSDRNTLYVARIR